MSLSERIASRLAKLYMPDYPPAAVEVNAGIVRLATVTNGKGPLRCSYLGSRTLPATAVEPGPLAPNVSEVDAVKDAIAELVKESGYRGKAVSMLLSDAVGRASILDFDTLPARRRDLQGLVRMRLKKAVPFPTEDARLSLTPLAPDGRRPRLLAAAARDDVLAQYEALMEGVGLQVGLVDFSSMNLLPLVARIRAQAGQSGGTYTVVNADRSCFGVAIVNGDDLVFYRSKPSAEERATAEAMAREVRLCHLYHSERLHGGQIEGVWLREPDLPDPRLSAELHAEGGTSVARVEPFRVLPPGDDGGVDPVEAAAAAPLMGMVSVRRRP